MVDCTSYYFSNLAKFSYCICRDFYICPPYLYAILMWNFKNKVIIFTVIIMMVYFLLGHPVMMDDGFHYEGFAEALAGGKLDFKSFYGFQGLSFFAIPIFWLTRSHNSIIIASAIFSLLSVPLAYFVGKKFYQSSRAGIYFVILFLLTPYPYTTMMRGFQEAALLFFILLIIYGSINKKIWTPHLSGISDEVAPNQQQSPISVGWTPVAWAVGGVVKPFALVLFPLFIKNLPLRLNLNFTRLNLVKISWILAALVIGGLYLGASYYQTGHLINNAAINSYQQGNFDTGNPPPLSKSFVLGIKGYLRIGANLLLHFRKIMVSPLVIVLGAFALWYNKGLHLRKEIMVAIILNLLLVGSLTFSFSKYLLPMTTLFALASVNYLLKYKWLMVLVFIDSFFVFLPIWNYFGHNFWPNIWIYLIPFWLAITLFAYESRTYRASAS